MAPHFTESHFAKGVVTSVIAKAHANAAIYNNQLCSIKTNLSSRNSSYTAVLRRSHIPDKVSAKGITPSLFRTENAVTRIPQTGDDITMLIQASVIGCRIDIHIRMIFLKSLHAIGCC